MRSTSMRGSSASGPKWRATSSRSKRSIPAGTGVWVVKTVPARTASSAASKSRPSSDSSAIRSRPRNPACPSFVWNTSGCAWPVSRQYVRTARTPPMPSSISWSSRCSLPPPYSRSVTPAFAEVVLLDVRVEHQQRHPADLRQPDAGPQRPPAGEGQRDLGRGAVGLAQRDHAAVRSGPGPDSAPAASRPGTATAGSSRAGRAVRRRSAVRPRSLAAFRWSPGEDAEAAGVLRQRGRDAELG